MINNHLSDVDVAGVLQSIAFVFFFIFFIVAAVWAIKSKKEFITEMSNKPLEDAVVKSAEEHLKQ